MLNNNSTQAEVDAFLAKQKCCSVGCDQHVYLWDSDRNKGVCKVHTKDILELLRK